MASAVAQGLRPDNPAYRTRLKQGTKKEATFLTPEEFSTILHFAPVKHERFLMFLAGSGCRWGEATAVRWSDLNLTAATPTIRITQAWKKGKTSSPVLKQPKSQDCAASRPRIPRRRNGLGQGRTWWRSFGRHVEPRAL